MRAPLAMLCLLAACGSTIHATQINPAPHAMRARAPASVEVFTSGPPKDVTFVDVAFFEAEQDTEWSLDDTPEMITNLRERAAKMGCDGLVIGGVTNAATVGIVDLQTTANRKGLTGTCIAYTGTRGSSVAAAH